MNWLPADEATHDAIGGLLDAWAEGTKDEYDIEYPDGAVWNFFGFVTNIAPSQPVDGAQTAAISIRPSGGQTITP